MKARDAESASSSALGQNESLCPSCKKVHTSAEAQPSQDISSLINNSQETEKVAAQQTLAEEEAAAFGEPSLSVPKGAGTDSEPSSVDKSTESIGEKSQKLAESEEEAFDNIAVGGFAMSQAEAAVKQEEANHLKAKTKSLETDNDIKKWIADKTFKFMAYWCSFVAVMVWMYFGTKQGQIEKEVIIALLGTTTISVVGLVGFIVKGLFGVKEDKPAPKEEKKK